LATGVRNLTSATCEVAIEKPASIAASRFLENELQFSGSLPNLRLHRKLSLSDQRETNLHTKVWRCQLWRCDQPNEIFGASDANHEKGLLRGSHKTRDLRLK
jgi:hypothetical protein